MLVLCESALCVDLSIGPDPYSATLPHLNPATNPQGKAAKGWNQAKRRALHPHD